MVINARQEWSLKKLRRVRDLEMQGNGSKGEVYVKASYSDDLTHLFYEINTKGVISLRKKVKNG